MLENYDKICKRFGGTAKMETIRMKWSEPETSFVCKLPDRAIKEIRAVIQPQNIKEQSSRHIALLPPLLKDGRYSSDYDIEAINISTSTFNKYTNFLKNNGKLGDKTVLMRQRLPKSDGGIGSTIHITRRANDGLSDGKRFVDKGYYGTIGEQTLFDRTKFRFSEGGDLVPK